MNYLFNMQNIYWREPLWLLLSFQPLIIILIKKLIEKNTSTQYAEKKLLSWIAFPSLFTLNINIFSKNSAYIVAWVLFSIALAGPRTPISQTDNEPSFGPNIMLVIDLSRSMNATDIIPSRLRRAVIEIHELLEKSKKNRIGVTVFSARPHLYVPLTSDHNALRTYLDSIEKLTFPTMGSDAFSAILLAQNELLKTQGKSAVVLITDGDIPVISEAQLQQLQRPDIPLYILGVGTIEGEAIQTKNGSWLQYNDQDVVSRMNEDNLHRLSRKLNGRFTTVQEDDSDWNSLYDSGIARQNTFTDSKSKQQIIWQEHFHYFLFTSILLFWLSLAQYKFKLVRQAALFYFAVVSVFLIPESNSNAFEMGFNFAQTIEQSAYRAYTSKKYIEANEYYKKIEGYEGRIGQGNSLYKMGHYQDALVQYVSATISAETISQRANALYNLANTYFSTGDFSSAITTYEDVLRYEPDNKYCLHNIKISQLLIENIKKRIEEREKTITSSQQGNGPRSASIEDGSDISENTSVSIGSNKNDLDDNIPLPEIPDIDNDKIKNFITKGLKHIKLAEQGISTTTYKTSQTISNIELLNTQRQLNTLNDSQSLLWKRLFELEEGFPAPVIEPKMLPGIQPW